MNRWYAVHTKARQEFVARENLERQGFSTYLPLIRMARRRAGRARGQVEALLPGYLFVEMDVACQSTASIRSTRGAIGLVRFGGSPCAVPPPVIEGLQQAQATPEEPIDPATLFRPGDRVTVVSGPLAGLEAIFKALNGTERVCLFFDMLGRTNEVTVDARHVALAMG